MRVNLVEEMVFRSPPHMLGWRFFRVEYGGHAETCLREGAIWIPPDVDFRLVEELLQRLCKDAPDDRDGQVAV